MYDTDRILFEILTEEIFRPYIFETVYLDNDSLEKACENFVYAHDISSLKIDEDLSDDFETSGHITYNVNTKSGPFLQVTFEYSDGDLIDVDYDVKDKVLFKTLIGYSMDVVFKALKEKIEKNI